MLIEKSTNKSSSISFQKSIEKAISKVKILGEKITDEVQDVADKIKTASQEVIVDVKVKTEEAIRTTFLTATAPTEHSPLLIASNTPIKIKLRDIVTYRSVKFDKDIANFARLAAHVYGSEYSTVLPHGCKVIDSCFDDTGLCAKTYLLDSGEVVCSFRGTHTARDWSENIGQVVGLSSQYKNALRYGDDIRKQFDNVIFTGHSQGGGEAALCAFSFGKKAVTFNAAGLSKLTMIGIPKDCISQASIQAYVFANDLLNAVQSVTTPISAISFNPLISDLTADGHIHYISDHNFNDGWHGIDGILRYFEIEK